MIEMKDILWILVLSAAFLIPGSAQTEKFESLEYGFSVEYPR